jgi:hypothetical protein
LIEVLPVAACTSSGSPPMRAEASSKESISATEVKDKGEFRRVAADGNVCAPLRLKPSHRMALVAAITP